MNCCWCGANPDDSDSHGICPDCFEAMALESAIRTYERTASYAESNAAKFAQECDELLRQEELVA